MQDNIMFLKSKYIVSTRRQPFWIQKVIFSGTFDAILGEDMGR